MDISLLAKIVSATLSYPIIGFFEIVFLTIIEAKCSIFRIIIVGTTLHSIIPSIGPLVHSLSIKKGDTYVSSRVNRPALFIPV